MSGEHTLTFTCNDNRLYVYPIAELYLSQCQECTIPTSLPSPTVLQVDTNTLSKREQLLLKRAQYLHCLLGHSSDDRIIKLLTLNKIIDCPITASEYKWMRSIIGPCLDCLRAKMTISHQDAITIEQLYPTEDHQDILFSDIFYLKGSTVKDPYLITARKN